MNVKNVRSACGQHAPRPRTSTPMLVCAAHCTQAEEEAAAARRKAEGLREIFSVADSGRSGYIDEVQLADLAKAAAPEFTSEKCRALLSELDTSSNGQVSCCYIVLTYTAVAFIAYVLAYVVMAYVVMAYTVMAYTVMAYMVMAYTVMAYMVMAYIAMAYIVMAILPVLLVRRWCSYRL